MNVSKLSLFLLMSTAATITLCDQPTEPKTIVAHVGDIFDISVGPIKLYNDLPNCTYEVANPESVYFHLNPLNPTNILIDPLNRKNILTNFRWETGPDQEEKMVFHCVKAIKPGTVNIIYNRIPVLDGCGCDILEHAETSPSTAEQALHDCKVTCDTILNKQTLKAYRTVKVIVLPAE